MNQYIGETFQEFSRKQHKDMESRQRLTQLLDQQLDLNEELRTENNSLVENQRKLLQLLQMRDQVIGRIHEVKPHNDTHNSTFQQSRLFNDTANVRQRDSPQKNTADAEKGHDRQSELESLKAIYEATKAANSSLEGRITTMSALILQKDQEVEKARLYNAEVYQKMEQQHDNDEREILRLKEKLRGLTLELENKQKETVALQQKSEFLKQEQQHATKDKIQRLILEIDLTQKAKEKVVKQCQVAISANQQLIHQYQRKMSEMEQTIQLNNADYEKRVEQLEESLANSLQEIKEKYHIIGRYEQQDQLMKQQLNMKRQQCKKLSENLLQSEDRLQTLQEESLRDDQTVEELKEMINKIKKQMDLQIRNNSNLRKEIIELQRQAKSRQDIEINESSKLEEMQLTIEQLQARNDRCKDDAEKTIEKLQRELERKDKQIVDVKKSIKLLENQINTRQQTTEQLQSKLSKITETAGMKEKKLKDQLQKALEETDKVRNENRNLKKQLENMDGRVRGILSGLEDKNLKLQNELHVSNNQSKHLQNDNEHLKRLYEKSELELSDARETLQAKHRENQVSRRRISDLEKELLQSKDQLKDVMEDTNKQEELSQLRKELNQSKLRLTSVTEANSKMKAQNTELVRETIALNEFKVTVNGELEKLKSQLKGAKQQKASLENKMNMLEQTLQEKNMQMEKSSPYITRLVEEKKIMQVDNVKLKNQNNMYHHLLEVAKKSKADQILNLNNSITTLKKNQSKWQNELKEANKTIENNNREKVNMMRENTVRQDHYVKIQKENKQLQEDNSRLLQQIKRLQTLFDQYQEHLQVAEKLANHYSESTQREKQRYEPIERRTSSRFTAQIPSKLDVSPIRSASNTKNNVSSSEVIRSTNHNTRSMVQQRIKNIEQDVLGRE